MSFLGITGIIASIAIVIFVVAMLYLVVLGYRQDDPDADN